MDTEGDVALSVREVVGDVQDLPDEWVNASALFQVASQFNPLEIPGPSRTLEDGVGTYQQDYTQGLARADKTAVRRSAASPLPSNGYRMGTPTCGSTETAKSFPTASSWHRRVACWAL